MSRTERREIMMAHVAAWKASGRSRKSYCADHDLSINVMNYWCARAHKQEPATGFAAVEISITAGMEVHYPNGVRLVLPAGVDMAHVVACIRLY